jgi:DNA-binding transcriptional LysR family regulator
LVAGAKTGCFVPGTDVTEAGEVYFKRCQSIVEEARIAHESLLYVVERPTGTLRVSMPADLATDHLAPIIADFAKTYPLIAFEFDLSPRHVDLQTEPFDLAIRIGPPPMTPLTLIARPIAVLPRYLYASPEYLKNAAPLTHPSDLARHVVCIVEGATRSGEVARTFYRGDESVDVMIGTRFAMNSVALNRGLAIQGVGLAVLDDVLARDDGARCDRNPSATGENAVVHRFAEDAAAQTIGRVARQIGATMIDPSTLVLGSNPAVLSGSHL